MPARVPINVPSGDDPFFQVWSHHWHVEEGSCVCVPKAEGILLDTALQNPKKMEQRETGVSPLRRNRRCKPRDMLPENVGLVMLLQTSTLKTQLWPCFS